MKNKLVRYSNIMANGSGNERSRQKILVSEVLSLLHLDDTQSGSDLDESIVGFKGRHVLVSYIRIKKHHQWRP